MKVSDAKNILEKTLLDMESLYFSDVIDTNYELYWMVPTNEVLDINSEPSGYEVGNIAEEYESINNRLKDGGIIFPDSLLFLSALFRIAYELSGNLESQSKMP